MKKGTRWAWIAAAHVEMKARWSRHSGPIRKMWPAKRSLHLMIVATKLKRGWVAVSPVIWARQWLLNPFIFFWVDERSCFAPLPLSLTIFMNSICDRLISACDNRHSSFNLTTKYNKKATSLRKIHPLLMSAWRENPSPQLNRYLENKQFTRI